MMPVLAIPLLLYGLVRYMTKDYGKSAAMVILALLVAFGR